MKKEVGSSEPSEGKASGGLLEPPLLIGFDVRRFLYVSFPKKVPSSRMTPDLVPSSRMTPLLEADAGGLRPDKILVGKVK